MWPESRPAPTFTQRGLGNEKRDFCFWLQGFFEIAGATELDHKQTEIIQNHLRMVFAHEIDPSFGDKKQQDLLDSLHHTPGMNLPY